MQKKWAESKQVRDNIVNLFVKRIYCGDCGKRMRFVKGNNALKDKNFYYTNYVCGGYLDSGYRNCSRHGIRYQDVVDAVFAAMQVQMECARNQEKMLQKHSVAVPKEEQVIVENKHPGIITKEEFIKAQKIFRENRATKRVTEKDYPLWRKVKCGTCGRAMPFKDRIIRGRPYRYFACPHAQAQVGENGCSKEYIREDVLNGVVWESIKTLLAAADGVKEQVKQKQKEAD